MLHEFMCVPTLPATDLQRARGWYADKLGLEAAEEREGELQYETGKGTGFLLYESQFAGTNQATAMGWMVMDFDAEMAELRRRGVQFEEYDLPGLKTDNGVVTDPLGRRGAWFKDCEGNILAINEAV